MKKVVVTVLFVLCLLNVPSQGSTPRDGESKGPRLPAYLSEQSPFNLTLMRMKRDQPPLFYKHPEPEAMLRAVGGGGAPVAAAQDDCRMQCDNEYAACAEMECGSPTSLCDPCLTAMNQCRDACPPPPCSPTTTYTTQTYLKYCMQRSGPMCMYSYNYGCYTTHYYSTCYFDRYYISRTQNCDGTVTESVYYSDEFSSNGYFDTGEYCY